jgi:hypothetical protein
MKNKEPAMTEHFRSARTRTSKKLISSALVLLLAVSFFTVSSQSDEKAAFASTPNSPIMGTSQLTGAQVADWYRSKRGSKWPLLYVSLNELANLFVNEGNRIGVRGDVAFAQAVHETGWFGSNCAIHKNNYGGIGASGPCMNEPENGGGYVFLAKNGLTGPQRAVRAQLHQLRNYADATSVFTWNPAPEFSKNTFFYKGKAKTWIGLNGKYAVPGTTYAQTIFNNYYNPMLARFGLSGYCEDAPPVAQQTSGSGYWTVTSAGAVTAFGSAASYGGMNGRRLNGSILGIAPTGSGNGYWMVGSDGGIFSFGDAQFYGSTGAIKLNKPIVGMASTPTGRGYWLVASDGGIFSFGDARFFGSTGSIKLNKPIVGMAPTPNGRGYWLVASDGGIFAFGNARFFGSTGSIKLNQPIVGMAARPQSDGYWLVARDGGIFSFGRAGFKGSVASCGGRVVTSIQPTPSGGGYYVSSTEGRVTAFGDARYFGAGAASTIAVAARD